MSAPNNELLEAIMVEIKGLAVPGVLRLFAKAVIVLDVEYLLDVEKDLDDPVPPGRPLVELCLQLQLSRGWVDQRVEYLTLENDCGHHFRVLGREVHSELDNGIRVYALLAHIDAMPLRHV